MYYVTYLDCQSSYIDARITTTFVKDKSLDIVNLLVDVFFLYQQTSRLIPSIFTCKNLCIFILSQITLSSRKINDFEVNNIS